MRKIKGNGGQNNDRGGGMRWEERAGTWRVEDFWFHVRHVVLKPCRLFQVFDCILWQSFQQVQLGLSDANHDGAHLLIGSVPGVALWEVSRLNGCRGVLNQIEEKVASVDLLCSVSPPRVLVDWIEE